jgi:hypothetical protein
MGRKLLHWLGIALILQTGLIHLVTAQRLYELSHYVGYLFVGNFLCSLMAAYGMYRQKTLAWALGAFIAAGSIVGFIWSRTLGLPGMAIEEWIAPYGFFALVLETLFLLLLPLRPWKIPPASESLAQTKFAFPTLALVIVILCSLFAWRWDSAVASQILPHKHVGSLDEVCSTPLTSFEEAEQIYGVKITLVATSMMDSVVDVRLKVVDAKKAESLLANQAALLVDQQVLVLAPHMHRHNAIKTGKVFFMFFPTQNKTIRTGSQVSLVFGSVRIAPVEVK